MNTFVASMQFTTLDHEDLCTANAQEIAQLQDDAMDMLRWLNNLVTTTEWGRDVVFEEPGIVEVNFNQKQELSGIAILQPGSWLAQGKLQAKLEITETSDAFKITVDLVPESIIAAPHGDTAPCAGVIDPSIIETRCFRGIDTMRLFKWNDQAITRLELEISKAAT